MPEPSGFTKYGEIPSLCPKCEKPVTSNTDYCDHCGTLVSKEVTLSGDQTIFDFDGVPYLLLSTSDGSQEFFLRGEDVIIGRSPKNTISLPDDPKVSRHHAQLSPKDNTYVISDLQSTNGTFVNGVRVNRGQSILLREGDEIKVGDTSFSFHISLPEKQYLKPRPQPEDHKPTSFWEEVPLWGWIATSGGGVVLLIALVICAIAGIWLVTYAPNKEETSTPILPKTTDVIVKGTVTRTPTPHRTKIPSPTYTPMPTKTRVRPTATSLPPARAFTPTKTPVPTSTLAPRPGPGLDFKIVKQEVRHIRPDKCDDLPEIEMRVLDRAGRPLDHVRLQVYWEGGQIFFNSGWLGPGYVKANLTSGTFWVKVTGGVPPFDENVYTSEVSRPLSTDQPTREDLEKAGYCQPNGECANCKVYSYEVVFQRQW